MSEKEVDKEIKNLSKDKIEMRCHPCEHKEHRVPIEHSIARKHAQITDIKHAYPIMKELQEYTGWILIGFDEKNKSLDIYFKRNHFEWDWGAGIQINKLTEDDKDALRAYLIEGK